MNKKHEEQDEKMRKKLYNIDFGISDKLSAEISSVDKKSENFSTEEKAYIIFVIICNTGLFLRTDIERAIIDALRGKVKNVENEFSTFQLHSAFHYLVENNLLYKDSFMSPKQKHTFYYITELGDSIFRHTEKKDAIMSKMINILRPDAIDIGRNIMAGEEYTLKKVICGIQNAKTVIR